MNKDSNFPIKVKGLAIFLIVWGVLGFLFLPILGIPPYIPLVAGALILAFLYSKVPLNTPSAKVNTTSRLLANALLFIGIPMLLFGVYAILESLFIDPEATSPSYVEVIRQMGLLMLIIGLAVCGAARSILKIKK